MVNLCEGRGIIFCNRPLGDKDCIETPLQMDFAEEIICVKNVSIIPMDKDIYEKCITNKLRLLVIIAGISFKKEGILDFDLQNILGRINILLKYYDINCPEKKNNKVYFKPNISKIISMIKIKELGYLCL